MKDRVPNIIGNSEAINNVRKMISEMAQTDSPVLITGESGVGKELVARAIHHFGKRTERPLLTINIGAIPDELIPYELFGYEKGDFTGVSRNIRGRFEVADKGTLILDGIEDAALKVQQSLMLFLDTSKIYRLGDSDSRKLDVRIIATSIYQYDTLLRTRKVMIDLLSRFNKVIYIPPLRERRADIPDLVKHLGREFGYGDIEISSPAMQALKTYDFPGNVRELGNVLERAAASAKGRAITLEDLGLVSRPQEDNSILREQIESLKTELNNLQHTTIPAKPIWEGRSFPTEGDYCFVLMPFDELNDIQSVYQNHIKPILVNKCGLRCERADDIYNISGIMQSVWEGINRAKLIVADLTGRNPNVFYELGIAHTLGKPVIMITQSMDYVPFDLRHLRCIVYEFKPGKIGNFERALERTVQTVLSSLPSRLR